MALPGYLQDQVGRLLLRGVPQEEIPGRIGADVTLQDVLDLTPKYLPTIKTVSDNVLPSEEERMTLKGSPLNKAIVSDILIRKALREARAKAKVSA